MRSRDVGARDAHGIAAWPQDILRSPAGVATGFTMRRIENRFTIATAMNPGSRKAAFPNATWAWLVHVGRNLAVAMQTLHEMGIVVGDVNDSNVLVGTDTFVRFIDVDSFQVRDGSKLYACDVGMPIYQPPELYGRSYAGLERTPSHDNFGLAVLLFQLIFMGRHPWAGVWKGADYEFDTGEVIAKLPFAFGREAEAAGHRPPPNSVRLDRIPDEAADLFERAFGRKTQEAAHGRRVGDGARGVRKRARAVRHLFDASLRAGARLVPVVRPRAARVVPLHHRRCRGARGGVPRRHDGAASPRRDSAAHDAARAGDAARAARGRRAARTATASLPARVADLRRGERRGGIGRDR